ncbi:FkbM family methyltransferase [Sphingomonas sp. 28-63-12]|uniref:FkbM family methyltransferase n=1 Tax=Sphingomonas sp. 28-63-12 TaxID=1970434 RepID=UPI0035A9A668
MISTLKRAVPDGDRQLGIYAGPFRGGVFHSNPRVSLRKMLGLYEHELNGWLSAAMQKVDLVIDVGGNDGYFTFGAAAAMKRAGSPRIVTFEPLPNHFEQLRIARQKSGYTEQEIRLINLLVGATEQAGMTTLDLLPEANADHCALIKIDVEGAELDVLAGAKSWIAPGNHFLIEVHDLSFFEQIDNQFAHHGIKLDRVYQQPLPILGREYRDADNGWLVTRL